MIPSRGMMKATLSREVVSMIPPTAVASSLLPNPIKPCVPTKPPRRVVSETVGPEAKGIIAPGPGGPEGPVAPVGPIGPVGPVAPVGPVGPMACGTGRPWLLLLL